MAKGELSSNYPNNYGNFFKYYSKFRNDTEEIKLRLLYGESKLDWRVLNQLALYSRQAEICPSHKVREARTALKKYFMNSGHVSELAKSGAMFFLMGSLQYNDPRNFDADFVVATMDHAVDIDALTEIDSDLSRIWVSHMFGRQIGIDLPHNNDINLSDYGHKLVYKFIEEHPEVFVYGINSLCGIISGIPLYPEERERSNMFKSRAIQFVQSDPLVCVLANKVLSGCLDERIQRRQKR